MFVYFYFTLTETRLDISCESSAMIHMICQVLFRMTNNKEQFKMASATIFLCIF